MPLGQIAFLGSGETSLAGGRIFESLARTIEGPLQIALIETPAGFELNSTQVVGRVGDFMKSRLQNYKPDVRVIPARKKNSNFSPDDPEIIKPLLYANMIFMGPGSPTYAIRHLKDTLTWNVIRARHRLGATLVFASAATISIGAHALPVYEIYKVGQDVHVVDRVLDQRPAARDADVRPPRRAVLPLDREVLVVSQVDGHRPSVASR